MNIKIIYKVECDKSDTDAIYNGYFQTKPFKLVSEEFIVEDNMTVLDFLSQTCLKDYPGRLTINGDYCSSPETTLKELAVMRAKYNIFICPIVKAGENYILSRDGAWEDVYVV